MIVPRAFPEADATQITRYVNGDPNYNTNGGEKGLKRRWSEQVNGQYGPDTSQWAIHNNIIDGLEANLRAFLTQFDDDDCGPPPVADAWKWATRGIVPDNLWRGNYRVGPNFLINSALSVLTDLLYLGILIENTLQSVPAPPVPDPVPIPDITWSITWGLAQ